MIAKDIHYIGVNDHRIDLFESQYTVPNGVSYNSYVITDGKIAVMDTVDAAFTHEWLDNLETVLKGRKPDYLVIQHMEPDHSASIAVFKKNYPDRVGIQQNGNTFCVTNAYLSDDRAPQTGDNFDILPYLIIMLVSGILLIILGIAGRKKRYEE